jgi:nucleoside-diphosphate-sugar epimerase
VDLQYFVDVRQIKKEMLAGVDAIVHLAGISNDPMGNRFEEVTLDVNHRASVQLARKAKEAGVKAFVFASSCSMYGAAEDIPRTEKAPLNPLTAYAKSKVLTERDLEPLADKGFKVTSLRFSTACGISDRLRLDLVLNDFVAGAVASKRITILSDGTPWRPLINTKDMARAIDWAIIRDKKDGGDFLAVNVGSDEWNYQVKDLAEAVARVVPGVDVSINKDAQPDKRSYRVSFDLFRRLAPEHQPKFDLITTIKELWSGLEAIGFNDKDFRNSKLIRLKVLTGLRDRGLLTGNLEWTNKY